MFEIPIEIKESEVESEYKHVHHAQTLIFLERTRLAFMEHIGYPNPKLISEGFFLVIASINVQYKREIFSGNYRFTVEDVKVEDKDLFMRQRVINEKGKDCVEAAFIFRLIDGRLRRSVVLPEKLSQALQMQ